MCHIDREGRRAPLSHHKVLERHFISQTSLSPLDAHATPHPPIKGSEGGDALRKGTK